MELNRPEVGSRFWHLMTTEQFSIPAFWDYPVWDPFMYHIMCEDTGRLDAYRAAIGRAVRGRTVVEVGTGDRAPLALMCAEAGARRVYAIEASPAAAEAAVRTVRAQGREAQVEIVRGSSMSVELPEKVDLCVSEIIGCVGSSEGAVPILRNARRFLKDGGLMLPHRCITRIAPVTLPEGTYHDDLVQQVVDYYTERVRQVAGRTVHFTRHEYYNFPASHLLAASATFEDLRFNGDLPASATTTAQFPMAASCRCDGFLLWLNLYVDEQSVIDTFGHSVWGAVYMACQPLALGAGDVLHVRCTMQPSTNGINPDYVVECTARRDGEVLHSSVIESRY